jgi:resuscitation-promoting factor RpfA
VKVRIALATAAVILETGSGSVFAQPMPAYPGVYPAPYPTAYPVLPPFEIVAIVRSKGFEPLARPMRQGPTYWVRAADSGGREMQVIVDATAGRIVRIIPTSRIGGMSPPYPIPPGRMVPDGNGPNSRMGGSSGGSSDTPDRIVPQPPGMPPAGPTSLPTSPPASSPRAASVRAPLPRPRPIMPSVSASAADPAPGGTPLDPSPSASDIDE